MIDLALFFDCKQSVLLFFVIADADTALAGQAVCPVAIELDSKARDAAVRKSKDATSSQLENRVRHKHGDGSVVLLKGAIGHRANPDSAIVSIRRSHLVGLLPLTRG